MIECSVVAGAMMLLLTNDPSNGVEFIMQQTETGVISGVAELAVPFNSAARFWSQADRSKSVIIFSDTTNSDVGLVEVTIDARKLPGFSLPEFLKTCG